MDFPDWAPKALCDYYNRFAEYQPEKEEERERLIETKGLLERLLTDETMIPVWRAFAKKDMDSELYLVFFGHVDNCYLEGANRPPSWADRIEQRQRIVKNANELARAIKNTEFDRFPNLWLDESDQTIIFKERIEIDSELSCLPVVSLPGPIDPHLLTSKMSTILKKLAAEALKSMKRFEGKTGPTDTRFVYKYGAKNVRANYFIRRMSTLFRAIFGSVRNNLLGRLASVALNDPEIDENTVRSSLNEWRNSAQKIKNTRKDK